MNDSKSSPKKGTERTGSTKATTTQRDPGSSAIRVEEILKQARCVRDQEADEVIRRECHEIRESADVIQERLGLPNADTDGGDE